MRILFLLAAVVLVAASLYEPLLDPCGSPLTYRVGTIDAGFRMTRNELVAALQRAELVWERPAGRNLFEYAPEDGEIVVRLTYDERQQTAQDNVRRKEEIDAASTTAKDLRLRHEDAARRYETARAVYQADKAAHEARIDAHNREAARWNARGGAPPEALRALRSDEEQLERESAELEERRLEVNALADHANKLSERHSATIRKVNNNVEAINTTAGAEFQQGLYVRDSRGVRIDIYKYSSSNDLVHVLAHEMGHAIRLDHTDDPAAIMYGVNSSESVVASPTDIAMLRRRCGF